MPSHVVATDSFVLTARGAVLLEELEPGEDQVLIVRGGALKLAELEEVARDEPRATWRLVTAAGDIVVARGSFVMTREGPLAGQEVALRIESGRQPRMEVVRPGDLPAMGSDTRSPTDIKRACVLSLPMRIVQIPRNGVDALVVNEVERYIRDAQLNYHEFRDERWVAFQIDASSDDHDGSLGPWGKVHADALLNLTAWTSDGGSVVSRVRFEDSPIRRRILASLAGSRRGFEVKWVPAYRPIECRLRLLAASAMKPFVPVQAAIVGTGDIRRLEIKDPGHLVLGLAVVAPHAG